jgi:hypothetical protein
MFPVQDAEALVVRLLLDKRLQQRYRSNAYSTNAYLEPGPYAPALLSLKPPASNWDARQRITHIFPKAVRAKSRRSASGVAGPSVRKRKRKVEEDEDNNEPTSEGGAPLAKPVSKGKGKAKATPVRDKRKRAAQASPTAEVEDEGEDEYDPGSDDGAPLAKLAAKGKGKARATPVRPRRERPARVLQSDEEDDVEACEGDPSNFAAANLAADLNRAHDADAGDIESESEDTGWAMSMREQPRKRARKDEGGDKGKGKEQAILSPLAPAKLGGVRVKEIAKDVIEFSDSD